MVDTLLDDIKELILKEKGDLKILERIKRAAERKEVISVFERAYINKLAEQYLRPPKEISPEPTEIAPEPKEISQPQTNTVSEVKTTSVIPQVKKINREQKPLWASKKEEQKTTKIMIGIGIAALAVILVVGLSLSGFPDVSITPIQPLQQTPEPQEGPLTIETDLSSYDLADIISISGEAETSGEKMVEVSIENPQKKVVWSENLKVKENGEFTTLVLAGGPGWEDKGEYTLKVKQGSLFKEISFNFNS